MFIQIVFTCIALFAIGSIIGYGIEIIFRRIFTAHRWINPGFLVGPYLPLYGFGLVAMYILSFINFNTGIAWLDHVLIIVILTLILTLIEYITGLIFIKGMHIKLWDYSNRWGNIQGVICPLFTLLWGLIVVIYHLLVNPIVTNISNWLMLHPFISFVFGIFYGVIIIDVGYSFKLTSKIKEFAKTNKVVIALEEFKLHLVEKRDELIKVNEERKEKIKQKFWFVTKTYNSLTDNLKEFINKKK